MGTVASPNQPTYYSDDILDNLTEIDQTAPYVVTQCSGSSPACLMSYKYNLAGMLTEETYPSGRIVHQSYGADGRLTAVSSRLAVNKPSKSYAQNFSYNAAGAVTGMQLGNMRWESTQFNSRLQPTQIALGTAQTGASATNLLKLQYGYGTTANNGNVLSQTIKVEDVGQIAGFEAVQTYTYDEVNRLKSATEMSTTNGTTSAVQSWKQTFAYDRFGNRGFDVSSGATTTLPANFNASVYNPGFNPANNRFAGNQGYDYDAAGNVTQDATGKKFAYDAENKQKSFGTGGSDTNGGTYVYDGDGRRVKKVVGTEVNIFVYDASGKMVAEYATTPSSSPQVNYLTADTLGTPRINTDANGTVLARHDYMPFGEEIIASGSRVTGIGYGADSITQKFTQKERDGEVGLDFFQARYYSPIQGRFSSPDEFTDGPDELHALGSGEKTKQALPYADITNSQSLNKYVYVYNNPLRYIDPDGHRVRLTNANSSDRREVKSRLLVNLTKREQQYFTTQYDKKTGDYTLALRGSVGKALSQNHTAAFGMLVQTVKASGTVDVAISETYGTKPSVDSRVFNTATDAGGGATISAATSNSGNIEVALARNGNPHQLTGTGGQPISDPVSVIAAHEVLGHARRQLLGLPSGEHEARSDENDVRAGRGLPQRDNPAN